MGTDIEMHVERRREDGAWERVDGEWYDGRDYSLFCALAGVRAKQVRERGESVTPIAEPRGLPPDASPEVREALDDSDGIHSASWHTLATLQAYDWEAIGSGYFRGHLARMAELGPPDRVRAIFWFD